MASDQGLVRYRPESRRPGCEWVVSFRTGGGRWVEERSMLGEGILRTERSAWKAQVVLEGLGAETRRQRRL